MTRDAWPADQATLERNRLCESASAEMACPRWRSAVVLEMELAGCLCRMMMVWICCRWFTGLTCEQQALVLALTGEEEVDPDLNPESLMGSLSPEQVAALFEFSGSAEVGGVKGETAVGGGGWVVGGHGRIWHSCVHVPAACLAHVESARMCVDCLAERDAGPLF